MIFRYHPSAPHPVPWLRVLLGVQMCRNAYGDGPWEDLAASWQRAHPIGAAPEGLRGILRDALLHLPQIAGLLMEEPLRAFGGRTLAQLVDPCRVGPMALRTLQRKAGRALFHSPHWLTTEPLRLLALTGLDIATCPERVDHFIELQDTWMRRLSGLSAAA